MYIIVWRHRDGGSWRLLNNSRIYDDPEKAQEVIRVLQGGHENYVIVPLGDLDDKLVNGRQDWVGHAAPNVVL